MNIITHSADALKIAEVNSEEIIINSIEDGLELLGNLYYDGFDVIVLQKKNITSSFFDLKSGMAGEILQKFSNFRVRLAIVGDFNLSTSKSLTDFILECNKGKQVNFVRSIEEAISRFSN